MSDVRNNFNIGSYITVKVTNDPVTNGNNLLEAYKNSKNTKPNNQVLNAENRLSIIIPPGNYDLGTQTLLLDTQYIDIIGSTNAKEQHFIYSNIYIQNRGVIKQTVNDVKIKNLRVKNTNNTFVTNLLTSDPAVYLPASNILGTQKTEIENVIFECIEGSSYSTAITSNYIQYQGKYTKVITGSRSFDYIESQAVLTDCESTGDYSYGWKGIDGYLIRCRGQNYCFGSSISADYYTSFGDLKDCIGANYCFFYNTSFFGSLKDCTGDAYSFCSKNGIVNYLDSGGFIENCRSHGNGSFCSSSVGDKIFNNYGVFINCITQGNGSFSYNETCNSVFINCTANSISDYCFGSRTEGSNPYPIYGKFINCNAFGNYCFGYANIIYATFINCNSLMNSFVATTSQNNLGVYMNCVGTSPSFNI